jgi:ABC-type antimicrobial peptide transport system permease subunit
VRRAVLGGALAVAGAGGAAGLAAALGTSRVLASQLYEVSPSDPATLAGVCALLLAVALLAAWLPARRATRVSPTDALRAE